MHKKHQNANGYLQPARQLQKKGKEVFFRDPGLPFVEARSSRNSSRDFKKHMHSTFSIGGIHEGRVEFCTAKTAAVLVPGSLAFINPETLHSCNTICNEERSYSMLYLDVEWCVQVQKSLWQVDSFIPAEVLFLNDANLYHRYCKVIHDLLDSGVHLSAKKLQLFDLIVEVFLQSCRPQVVTEVIPERIDWMKKYLGEDLQRDMTLLSLARKLDTNPYTLLRRFKAVTGITPHAYRMNCRIEKARLFLQQGMDIADAALECGFFDQSHLHRHFKAATTVTPQEYRVNFIQ